MGADVIDVSSQYIFLLAFVPSLGAMMTIV